MNGLFRFNTENGLVKKFATSEGVQKGSFLRHTIFKTKQGKILFGGERGFNAFHPDNLISTSRQPKVYLTDLKIFNKKIIPEKNNLVLPKNISQLDQIVLDPMSWRFSIDYVAINFTHPENNKYAYRMAGLEKDWNFVGNVQTATYNNLPPGSANLIPNPVVIGCFYMTLIRSRW